jgi:hypothetical protein
LTHGLLDFITVVEPEEATPSDVRGYFSMQNLAAAGSSASGARKHWSGVVHGSTAVGTLEAVAIRPKNAIEYRILTDAVSERGR